MEFLKQNAKSIYTKTSLTLFNNKIGIKTNLLHILYDSAIKIKYSRWLSHPLKVNLNFKEIAQEIHTKGYAKIDRIVSTDAVVANIEKKINALIRTNDHTVTTLESSGLIRIRRSLVEIPEAEIFLHCDAIKETLRGFYNSDFKLFCCDIFRTIPVEFNPDTGFQSLFWHFDNVPNNMLKVMIYLTDTTKENGAIHIVPKTISMSIKKQGFWDRHKNDRFIKDIEARSEIIEGKAGTAVFFAPQFCIHKAVLPQAQWRDVIVFELHPSMVPFKPLTPEERMKCSRSFGYLINPFKNVPLRLADE